VSNQILHENGSASGTLCATTPGASLDLDGVVARKVLERIGARIWIARILITWGVVSLATGFAQSTMQLYVAPILARDRRSRFLPGHTAVPDVLV